MRAEEPRSAHLHLEFIGVGGPRAQEEGLESVIDPKKIAAHGLTEALSVLPETVRAWRILKRLARHVDAYLFVDAPELNMRLVHWIRTHGSQEMRGRPIFYLAPPQAWAWRPWRAQSLKMVNRVFCLFPFATEWYQNRGVHASCIGHPLRALPISECGLGPNVQASYCDHHKPQREVGFAPEEQRVTIAFFPGSRASSVGRALPLMFKGCVLMLERRALAIHIQVAETSWVSAKHYDQSERQLSTLLCSRGWIRESQARWVSARGAILTWVRIAHQDPPDRADSDSRGVDSQSRPHPALKHAALSLCYAGTSTLESALYGVPPITISPLSRLSTAIARRWVKVAYSALPNLILDRAALPELTPWESRALEISDALSAMIERYQSELIRGEGELSSDLRALRDTLPPLKIKKIAEAILGDLEVSD